MSDDPTTSARAVEGQEHLQRNLKSRHIQLTAIGGAIGTDLFMSSGGTVHLAESSLLLIYLLIGTMLLLVMRAMNEFLLHNLEYKSFQGLARDMFGLRAGCLVSWTYWILWVVTASTEVIVIAGCLDFWIKDMAWPMICMFILLMALLGYNLLAVKLFGEIEFWFALIKTTAILLLIVVGIKMTLVNSQSVPITHLWSAYGPLRTFPANGNNFLAAFQITIFVFIGIELIETAIAETPDPYETLPEAINATSVQIMIFYALALMVITSVTPWDKTDPGVSPFVSLFSMVGFVATAGAMNFVVLTSASSSANSGISSTSRMPCGLPQLKQMPESLGHLSKHQAPVRALTLSVTLAYVAFPVLVIGGSVMEVSTMVPSVPVGLVLFMQSLVLVCYIRYRKLHPEAHKNATFRMSGVAFMPWAVLGFFGLVVHMLLRYNDTRIALGLTFLWLAGLTISWFVRKKVHGGASQ